jgi:hypothetical protein
VARTPVGPTRREGAPAWAWVALSLLACVGLALPYLREPVLFADDFSSTVNLRRWSDNRHSATYNDGVYLLSTVGTDGWWESVADLPHEVRGMTIDVRASVVDGMPVFGVSCIAAYVRVDEEAPWLVEPSGAYYGLTLDPALRYAFFDVEGETLDDGVLSAATADVLTFGCASDGDEIVLWVQADGGETARFVEPGAATTFRAFGLGVGEAPDEGTVAFDDVVVTEATSEDG